MNTMQLHKYIDLKQIRMQKPEQSLCYLSMNYFFLFHFESRVWAHVPQAESLKQGWGVFSQHYVRHQNKLINLLDERQKA